MKRLTTIFRSSIGKKFIAAVTGLILFGFLVGHASGNLKIFTGADEANVPHIDHYAHFLTTFGDPVLPPMVALWGARIILLAALVLHVTVVIQLSWQSNAARPVDYIRSKKAAASVPALYMMVSGSLILFFIIFHIMHFTMGILPIGTYEYGAVYDNLAGSFTNILIALLYVAFMVVLAFHLFHGVWSLFQTLGLDNPDRNGILRAFAAVSAIGISALFAAVPLSFMTGVVPESLGAVESSGIHGPTDGADQTGSPSVTEPNGEDE